MEECQTFFFQSCISACAADSWLIHLLTLLQLRPWCACQMRAFTLKAGASRENAALPRLCGLQLEKDGQKCHLLEVRGISSYLMYF